ncbi:TetR/AcrR family transcriptional regulator [Rossellomorea aquimaris]|uniref:TetR/AcrR family transcriptional regulator n=1 Tax=Rossellomorea aquimaris TaxID=189382 RepID=UPI001CD2C985|nr:TetR/AcrR family transcriptional regulator [Rossellomorea aquimaris]MCA1055883.1 TetR/AcrR family transcriptional regulator [Rossellomorea aquimaris]
MMDRRIKKTKKSIKEALFKFAVIKGMENVTVQDIIDEADINRATFYYHYKDKYNLFQEIVDETLEGLMNDVVLPHKAESVEDILHPPALAFFKHVEKHIEIYKIIIGKKGLPGIRWEMLDTLKTSIEKNIMQLEEGEFGVLVEKDFLVNFIAGALLALIMDWIEGEMPGGASELADQFVSVITKGVFRE